LDSREELERRVAELEEKVAGLRQSPYRGVRFRSQLGIGNLPLFELCTGPCPERGELRGHARAVIAVGDFATGVVAVGGLARGLVAVGGLALGGISFGGLSLGVLLAVGGFAVGGLAFGGGAVGGAAVGGGAAGYYSCGGANAGTYTVSPARRDPEAERFFERYSLVGMCRTR
jgi:hypothetical protein